LGLTLALASISWKYLEKPLIRRGHAYSYDPMTAEEGDVTLMDASTLPR
jgi:peptidoglycan/LPS O-acetylase OafA/YrhL